MVILSAILGFMASSLVEYLLHKEYLHRDNHMHHITIHHTNYHGDRRFEIPHSKWNDIASSPAYIITNILLCLPLSVLVFYVSKIGALVYTSTAITYTLWVEWAHYRFHSPLNSSIERTEVFKKLKLSHKSHHTHYGSNFGIGSTVWDHILKTKRL